MTDRQKKMKVALAAVAYYLEQEVEQTEQGVNINKWSGLGKELIMGNRMMIQRKGRMLRSRA